MTSPDPRSTEYDRWSDLFELAWRDPKQADVLACPTCGLRTIHFVYLADTAQAAVGMFALWCSSCLRGFPPGYGPIPKGATVWDINLRGNIPNYDTVKES